MRYLLKYARVFDFFNVFYPFPIDGRERARRAVAVVDAALSDDKPGDAFLRSDVEAFRADWRTTGEDMRKAIDEYGKNFERA